MRQFNGSVVVLTAIVVLVIAVPLVYVASLGPVSWLAERGMISTDEGSVATTVYAPLQYASNNSPAAETAIVWYTSFFVS
jgi:hypothetical protein